MNTLDPTEERLATLHRLEQDAVRLAEELRPHFDDDPWTPFRHALNVVRALRAAIGEAERERS